VSRPNRDVLLGLESWSSRPTDPPTTLPRPPFSTMRGAQRVGSRRCNRPNRRALRHSPGVAGPGDSGLRPSPVLESAAAGDNVRGGPDIAVGDNLGTSYVVTPAAWTASNGLPKATPRSSRRRQTMRASCRSKSDGLAASGSLRRPAFSAMNPLSEAGCSRFRSTSRAAPGQGTFTNTE
jgi:hypothetical protein